VKDVQSIDVLDGVNLTPKRRSEIEKGLIKGWGVEVSPKKNYVIVYNTKGNKNHQLAVFIAERIERIREQVYEVQFPPAEPVKAVSIVRICGDAVEYHAYGGPGGSAGYWNDGTEELVFYDASPAKKVDEDTLSVLYHEAFHQFIYYSVGNVAPHSWFNEGHGDYYAGEKYVGGKFKIGPFDWRVNTIKTAVQQGPRSFTTKKDDKTGKERRVYSNDKGYTPLKDLVAFSQGEYYSYPGVCYARAGASSTSCAKASAKKKEWNAKWGKILDKYFAVLKREVNKEGKLHRGGDGPEPPARPIRAQGSEGAEGDRRSRAIPSRRPSRAARRIRRRPRSPTGRATAATSRRRIRACSRCSRARRPSRRSTPRCARRSTASTSPSSRRPGSSYTKKVH
jgi:hypothetical protein